MGVGCFTDPINSFGTKWELCDVAECSTTVYTETCQDRDNQGHNYRGKDLDLLSKFEVE